MEIIHQPPELLKHRNIIFDESVTKAKISYLNNTDGEFAGIYNVFDNYTEDCDNESDFLEKNFHKRRSHNYSEPIKNDPDKSNQLPITTLETNATNQDIDSGQNENNLKKRKSSKKGNFGKIKKPKVNLSGLCQSNNSGDIQNIIENDEDFNEQNNSSQVPALMSYNKKKNRNKFGFNLVG